MSTPSSRLRRWAIYGAIAFAVYSLVGFFVAPSIVRSQIEKRASMALDREVTVERVRMNPLSFSIAVHGLRVVDHDGLDLASWREAYINFDPLISLFKLEWHLDEFRLVDPRKRIVVDEDGVVNIADLITKFAAPSGEPKPSGGLPAAGVDRLSVQGWALDFTDRSRRTPFHTVFGPMTFGIEGFTTRPDTASPYVFTGTTDTGEMFSWTGNVSVLPLGSKGRLEFTGFSIPKHMPFAEHLLAGEVKSGRFSFKGDYHIALTGESVMQMENAVIAVDELSLGERGNPDPLVKMGHLEVNITRADAVARTAEVSRVLVDGLEVYATREEGGAIDLLRLMPAAANPASNSSVSPSEKDSVDTGPAPTARVDLISVSNGRVTLIDQTNSRTARVSLDQITVAATNAGTDLDREIGLEMSARWNERGTLAANGTVRALPLAAKLQVKGEGIDLAALDPLIEPFADVRLDSGDLWFAGTVEASLPPGGEMTLSWIGDGGLDVFAAREGQGTTELVGWKRVAMLGAEFQLAPLSIVAREIQIVEPTANVAMDEAGAINFLAVVKKEAPESGTAEPAARPAPSAGTTSERIAAATQQKLAFDARVDTVTISGARVSVADRSFEPGFATELRDFGGSIRGLSSANLARADVDLSGSLDGVAPLRISGQINPLADDVYSDITVLFSNIDLPIFSPYSGRFIGQKIQKGKLRVDLKYKLSQRFIEGKNSIVLDQFYLGDKVESPDALKLPVGLALKLMRDREGRIVLDPEVSGNLDDPDFSYARIVWRTIGNIFVKAMTSPFGFLGSLVPGGGSMELNQADFASGSSALTDETQKKIELLAAALHERPEITLEVSSPAAPTTDREGIVAVKFAQMLRDEKARLASVDSPAAADAPDAAPAPASTEVAPEEVNGLVASLFAVTFPEEAAAGAAAASAAGVVPVVQSEPAEESRPGFIRRTFRRVFGGGEAADTPAPGEAAAAEQPGEAGAGEAEAGAPVVPELTLEMMRDRLLASIEVSDDEFQAVARARAAAIRDGLLASGKLEAERIFIVDTASLPEGTSASTEGGRVFFNLQ